jgi:septum formation protein
MAHGSEQLHSIMLVLASASPRRQELLRNAAIEFTVRAAHVEERREADESPVDMVQRLARAKAEAIRDQLTAEQQDVIVIGADTTVVVGSQVLEKPIDEKDAARMLRLLSGRAHQVITGVCVAGHGFADVQHEVTTVFFDKITRQDIETYVATGESMDKAGAYAIQGIASRWIPRIEGDYFNVVGLPVALLMRMLKQRGALK